MCNNWTTIYLVIALKISAHCAEKKKKQEKSKVEEHLKCTRKGRALRALNSVMSVTAVPSVRKQPQSCSARVRKAFSCETRLGQRQARRTDGRGKFAHQWRGDAAGPAAQSKARLRPPSSGRCGRAAAETARPATGGRASTGTQPSPLPPHDSVLLHFLLLLFAVPH